MNVEIVAGATVRELIEKTRCRAPRGEGYVDETKVIYKLEFTRYPDSDGFNQAC